LPLLAGAVEERQQLATIICTPGTTHRHHLNYSCVIMISKPMSRVPDLMTLAEAAELTRTLGRALRSQALRRLCRLGWMRCLKIGTGRRATYLVAEADLREALATAPRRGGYRGSRRGAPKRGDDDA
jgi:hypothetical protein